MSARDKLLAYVESHNVMTLATEGPAGLWAAAVFYVTDGLTFYFLSSPGSRHGRNLLAEGRAAATIQEDYGDWVEIRGVQLEGEVHPIDGEEQAIAAVRYGRKFPAVADPEATEIRRALARIAWFRLEPRRLFFIDNSRGLGHRDEVRVAARAAP